VVAAIFVSALLVGLAATILFARLTARRLAETQAAADAIAQGDLTRRIPSDRLDGMFAVQAESLNRMLDRMEDMVNAQRQFSSHLAHDLRTPLTRLRGLLTAETAEADRVRLLERAERECASIITIFDALLRLAEIETGATLRPCATCRCAPCWKTSPKRWSRSSPMPAARWNSAGSNRCGCAGTRTCSTR
jgi:signal transduction histidine kinase